MSRKKRLNIHNTDRVFNMQIVEGYNQKPMQFINKRNEVEIVSDIKKYAGTQGLLIRRDNNHYHMFLSQVSYSTLETVSTYAGLFTLVIDKKVDKDTLALLAKNRKNGRAVSTLKEDYSFEEVQEIVRISEVISITMDVHPLLGDTSPNAVIIALSNVRYRVDKVQLVFQPVLTTFLEKNPSIQPYYVKKHGNLSQPKINKVYDFFSELRDACSHWKMNILIEVNNKNEKEQLEKLRDIDMTVRKGSSAW